MKKYGDVELDAEGNALAVWSLEGERIPAEQIVGVYLTYFPGRMSYVLAVEVVDMEQQVLSSHAVKVGGTGNELLKALRELARQLDWVLGHRQARWAAQRWFGKQQDH